VRNSLIIYNLTSSVKQTEYEQTATTSNRFASVHIHPFRSRETRLFDAAEKLAEEEKVVEDIAEKTLVQSHQALPYDGISNDMSRVVAAEDEGENSPLSFTDPLVKLSSTRLESQDEEPFQTSSSSSISTNLRPRILDPVLPPTNLVEDVNLSV